MPLLTTRRLFVALFIVALFTMAVRETLDPDMWWHLRTGEVIAKQGIPREDVFSFTVPEHKWITHEWLSQIFMWGVYRLGGLPGLIVTFAFLIALSFWLVFISCEGRPYLAGFVTLLAALAAAIVWGVRPQIFNLLLTAAFVHIIERYKQRRSEWPALWLLPLLTILWANLHSGYLLGTVLLSVFVVGEALQRRSGRSLDRALSWPQIKRLAWITAISFLLAALNPNGPQIWLYPFSTLGSPAMQAYIQEWRSPDFHLAHFWPFGLMLLVGITSLLFSGRRPTWSELLLFGGTAAAGLLSARHIPLFAIVSAPIASRHLIVGLQRMQFSPLLDDHQSTGPPTRIAAALNWAILLLALLTAVAWTATKVAGNDAAIASRYPVAAVDHLKQTGLATARGYNSYNWGGYLIWRGLPVFVDGRADVYGDEFLSYYRRAFDIAADWRRPLDDFQVDYVLMEQGSALSVLLEASDQWKQDYSDGVAQIFVRQSGVE